MQMLQSLSHGTGGANISKISVSIWGAQLNEWGGQDPAKIPEEDENRRKLIKFALDKGLYLMVKELR